MFCGCSAAPPPWLKNKYQINLDKEVEETINELEIKPLPPDLCGAASTRIAEAASSLGFNWFRQPKFMHIKENKFNCKATCMLGCKCQAKWNAAQFVEEAQDHGLTVKTGTKVEEILYKDHKIIGVRGKLKGKNFTATASTVILAAGGIGTPRILQRSGLKDAGIGMAMDTTVMVYGVTKESGNGNEPPMTWSFENDQDGYMLSTLIDPWLLYPMMAVRTGFKYLLTWPKWHKVAGIMIKLKDEISGGVLADGSISKPLTKIDQQRLQSARQDRTTQGKESLLQYCHRRPFLLQPR